MSHDIPDGYWPGKVTCRTFTGKIWPLEEPDPKLVDIVDIAHALSMQCRFNGHLRAFLSVAQHAVSVARVVYRETHDPIAGLQALHHDDSEAYLGDIIGPLKRVPEFAFYRVLEERTMEAIATALGLPLPFHPIIDEVDKRMCGTEQRDLGVNAVPDRRPYDDLQLYVDGDVLRGGYAAVCLEPHSAKALYLATHTLFETMILRGDERAAVEAADRVLEGWWP